MWKNRICYWGLTIAFAVLLFLFGKPYLLCVCILLITLAVMTRILLKQDMKKISINFQSAGEDGKIARETMWIEISASHRLASAGTVRMDLEIYNKMFGTNVERHLLFPLSGTKNRYQIPEFVPLCGEMQIRCRKIQIQDVLNLFSMRMKNSPQNSVIVYPRKAGVQLLLTSKTTGTQLSEGFTLNQKGKDPSEMFDIRDYVPGDDIRSIHWKLSSKTDSLILRQSSDPSHYRIAVLPDFSREKNDGRSISTDERNLAVSLGVSLGEQLLASGMAFCMAVPTDNGLYFFEINNEQEFYRMITNWMRFEVPVKEGTGLEYFKNQHREQQFTRMLILSAGRYQASLAEIQNSINITVIHTDSRAEHQTVSENGSVTMIEIPADQKNRETYRISC